MDILDRNVLKDKITFYMENKNRDKLVLIKHVINRKTYSFLICTRFDKGQKVKLFGKPVNLIMTCFNIVQTTRLKKILKYIKQIDTEMIFNIDKSFWDIIKIYCKQYEENITELIDHYKVSKKIIEIESRRKKAGENNFSRKAICS